MSRPLRLEFADAVYHVTSRGDRREPIYRDDADRTACLEVIAQAMDRFDAQVLAYCLMGNHYHLVIHTRAANLSRLMRHINGVYTQRFNRRHGLVGHLLQGRFKAILVDRDAYLLSLCRYVERNPLAARLVKRVEDWAWSSYRAHVLAEPTPPWLDSDGLHGFLLGRPVRSGADRRSAAARYARLMAEESATHLWEGALRQQVFLGDEAFVARMLAQASAKRAAAAEVPKRQRRAPLAMPQRLPASPADAERGAALRAAYVQGGLTMTEIARRTGLSVSRVSRLIAREELK
jgi:putative transposase